MVLRSRHRAERNLMNGSYARHGGREDSDQLPQELLDQLNDMWLKENEKPVKQAILAQLPRF